MVALRKAPRMRMLRLMWIKSRRSIQRPQNQHACVFGGMFCPQARHFMMFVLLDNLLTIFSRS